jgi:hypothetical protein
MDRYSAGDYVELIWSTPNDHIIMPYASTGAGATGPGVPSVIVSVLQSAYNGATGPTGPTGPTGATGPSGGPTGPTGATGPGVVPLYGAFISKSNQTPSATNPETTPVAITYDERTIGSIGVTGSYPTSGIVISQAGTYRVQFSAQAYSSSSTHYLEIWPVINGISVPDTNTKIRVPSSTEVCLTVEYFLSFAANDVLELYMIGDSVNGYLVYYTGNPATTPAIPNIPSIILTVMRIE